MKRASPPVFDIARSSRLGIRALFIASFSPAGGNEMVPRQCLHRRRNWNRTAEEA